MEHFEYARVLYHLILFDIKQQYDLDQYVTNDGYVCLNVRTTTRQYHCL